MLPEIESVNTAVWSVVAVQVAGVVTNLINNYYRDKAAKRDAKEKADALAATVKAQADEALRQSQERSKAVLSKLAENTGLTQVAAEKADAAYEAANEASAKLDKVHNRIDNVVAGTQSSRDIQDVEAVVKDTNARVRDMEKP